VAPLLHLVDDELASRTAFFSDWSPGQRRLLRAEREEHLLREPRAASLIIAHRGASGYRPEHTLEGYELAVRLGADYIEPDLVPTKDGVLVVRHENELSGTTDIGRRPEFASRRRTKLLHGQAVTGWFAEDLTLEEIRTLRARERFAFRTHAYDGVCRVPTLQEVIELARKRGTERGRPVGLYPELKEPAYFEALGFPLEAILLEALAANGLAGAGAPVYIQSFEPHILRKLRRQTELPLVQLLDERKPGDPVHPSELSEIATYADALGCHKRLLVPVGYGGRLGAPTPLAERAQAAGLALHAWTFRNEGIFLAADYEGCPEREYGHFRSFGVQGFFTDFPDTAAQALGKPGPATC
jgi:glycerophosphoryl diester phosphodiesterase